MLMMCVCLLFAGFAPDLDPEKHEDAHEFLVNGLMEALSLEMSSVIKNLFGFEMTVDGMQSHSISFSPVCLFV